MKIVFRRTFVLLVLSLVVYHLNAQTLLTESFEGTFPPPGWTITNPSSNPFSWQQNPYNAKSGSKCMDGSASPSATSNCWAFTPSLSLNSGVLYRISYWYKVGGVNTSSEKFKVTIGNNPTIAAQTTILHDYQGISPFDFIQGVDTFLVPAAGNYNIAFNYYSAANQARVLIDSVVLKQVPFNACSGTPVIGTATAPPEVKPDSSFTLNLSGSFSTYSGLAFQWQSSPTGVNNFTDIAGGNTVSFSTTENVNKDYRCRVTCLNSGLAVTSNHVTVLCANNGSLFRQKYNSNTGSGSINGIHFLSPAQGFAAFANSVGYTQDSGQTFSMRNITPANTNLNGFAVNNPSSFSANGVYAFSQDSILAYGDYAAEPTILFSADRGLNWRVVFHQPFGLNQNIANSFFDIKFFNSTSGVAINQKYLIYTTNRGLNWAIKYQIPSNSASLFSKLSVPTSQVGYAIGGNMLIKTTTASDYWVERNNGLPSVSGLYLKNISFVNATVGYLLREDNNSIYKTMDGGVSWQKINNDTLSPIGGSDMYFTSENIGYVSGSFRYVVSKTSNGGVTWEICKRNTTDQYLNYGMKRLFFLNSQTGWACGMGEFLMMTTTGGDPTTPEAFFKIDTVGSSSANTVKLVNLSKPFYQTQWFRNGTPLSTDYNTSFQRTDIFRIRDTITLVTASGGESDTLTLIQNYPIPNIPAPVITAFSPTTGVGGTSVLITGTNLYFTTAVLFGGIAAQSFTINSDNSITAIVGAGSTGVLQITAPNGNASKAGFTHNGPPGITSFFPAKAGPGSTITIKGYNLLSTNAISFGGLAATRFKIVSSTEIAATVGFGNSGDVKINAANGTTSQPGFIYTPLPAISSLSADTGSVGSVITINGANFSPIPDSNIVRFGTVRATVTAATASSLKVIVPTGASFKPISVTTSRLTAFSKKAFIVTFSGGGNAIVPTQFTRAAFIKSSGAEDYTINDFDADGKPDVAMAITYSYDPTYTFHQNQTTIDTVVLSLPRFVTNVPGRHYNLDYCDFDGDGNSDIIDNRIDSFLSIQKNVSSKGNIAFKGQVNISTANQDYSGYEQPTYFKTADYNGDGKPDVLLTIGSTRYYSTQLSVYRNRSIGDSIMFEQNKTPFICPELFSINTTDFDGDGRDDVLLNAKEYYRNTSSIDSISFVFGGSISNAYYNHRASIADVDGDGKNDIVAYDITQNTNNLIVLRNTSTIGSISFAPPYIVNMGRQIWQINISDMDGDGKPDIIVNKVGRDFKILKNLSTPGNVSLVVSTNSFFYSQVYSTATGTIYDIVDMDNNGKPDVVLYQGQGLYNGYDTVWVFRNITGEPLKTCVSGNLLLTSNLTGTSYQWQVSTDAVNFTNIADGANYAGTSTQNLQISNTPSAWLSYQYRCLVNGNTSDKFAIGFANYWKGTANNDWNNPANWSCGVVPDTNTEVYINAGTVSIKTNVVVKKLIVRPGANVSVATGYTITVTN